MKQSIPSPFHPEGKAKLKTREFRLWYQHQWILGSFYVYECEITHHEFRPDEVKQENLLLADKYLQKKITPAFYD